MAVKAILLKPLDGFPEGSEREFDKPDFDRLEAMAAVKRAPDKADTEGEKAAPPVANKKATPVLNKKAEG